MSNETLIVKYETGEVMEIIEQKNGVRHGKYIMKFKNGKYIMKFKNGKPCCEKPYVNGLEHGILKQYDSLGNESFTFTYEMGKVVS